MTGNRFAHDVLAVEWRENLNVVRALGFRLAALGAALLLTGCNDSSEPRAEETAPAGLRIASFDFDESVLLAEMYAQVVEATGVPVVRLGPIGPREILAPAVELDHVDVVPEYLGTALEFRAASEPNPDTESARVDLNARLARRGLTTLEPSPAEDKNVIVVTTETAERHDLEAISDLAPVAEGLRFGGPPECRQRSLCLLGLRTVYGLSFAEFVPQRSLVFTAEALRRGQIDVGLMFSTAPDLEATDLVVLTDDQALQPAENIIPVVRIDALDRWGPEVAAALNRLSRELTTGQLRILNLQVGNGVAVEQVAGDWLTQKGLLRSG